MSILLDIQEIKENRLLIGRLIRSMIKSGKIPDLKERVKVDLGNYYIVIGPNIAISIDKDSNFYETSLCFSQGDEDESYYNKRNDTKWISNLCIPQLRYYDSEIKNPSNVEDEIIRVIKYVKENPEIIAYEVSKARLNLQKSKKENDLAEEEIMDFLESS
jgi:hypothetical protein